MKLLKAPRLEFSTESIDNEDIFGHFSMFGNKLKDVSFPQGSIDKI